MKLTQIVMFTAVALSLAPMAALCSPVQLGQSLALNKLITPNHDGHNDSFIFRCYNPRDAAVSAKIYDLLGREIAAMRLKQRSNGIPPVTDNASGIYYDFEWDPNSGVYCPGGVYLYQIVFDNKTYTGTIVVIR